MDIWVYDMTADGLKTVGIVESISSFMWTERFYKADTFNIELSPTLNNSALFVENRIIAADDFSGIITAISITDKKMTVGGTSLNGTFSRRIIDKFGWQDTALTLVDKNCATLADVSRQFPNVIVDYSVDCPGYFSNALINSKLSDYTEALAKSEDFGIFGRINHNTKQIEVYGRYSQDRSAEQTANPPIVFSDNYENITDINYNYSNTPLINVVKVFSNARYDEADKNDIDAFEHFFVQGEATGFEASENYVEIEPVTTYEARIDALWKILDYDKTFEKAQTAAAETFSKATDNVTGYLILDQNWRQKFAVGDIITVRVDKYDKTLKHRISEITTFISSNKNVVDAVLGEPTRTLSDLLRKR